MMTPRAWAILLIALLFCLGGAYVVYTGAKLWPPGGGGAPTLSSFLVEAPDLVARGANLERVEVWAIPTGTGITANDYQKLGEAALASSSSKSAQVWLFRIPAQPLLATQLFARGYGFGGSPAGDAYLPQTGATEIYNALWGGESGANFDETGYLVHDSPGAQPGAWYLLYEKPGAPALTARLLFNTQSQCGGGAASSTCAPNAFAQGTRARVVGLLQGTSTVTVRTLAQETAPNETGMPVSLYYYDAALDQGPGGAQCSRAGLAPVTRIIPQTQTPIADTVRLLLRGELSPEERAAGLTTEFPLAGVSLQSASLQGGTLTLTFADPQNKTSGGSCRAGVLWFEIEATAKQFPGVQTVRYLPEELFQP